MAQLINQFLVVIVREEGRKAGRGAHLIGR
jgi:hypothetical protein